MSFLEKTRSWYGRFERPISSFSLVFGFIFDALTLKRLDTLWENLWILGHIILVAIFIILINIKNNKNNDENNPSKAHFWFVNILQFLFGGILSAFLVFYFRSTDILVTWPFLFILALAFIANESFKKHYIRLSFQISLLFLSIYSFMIFLVPIILHDIGMRIFIISGLVSLVIIILFIRILFFFTKDNIIENKNTTTLFILGIFVLVNFLYFTNLIPPIPLSLKESGVYHFIQKNTEGDYDIARDDSNWKNYIKLYPDFNKAKGSPLYVYSAIFSPRNLDLVIVHEWQHYDEINKKWSIGNVVNLRVVGGRDGGFRTYSTKSNPSLGKWRVNIKTEQGQIIGRIRFNVLNIDTKPVIINEVKK